MLSYYTRLPIDKFEGEPKMGGENFEQAGSSNPNASESCYGSCYEDAYGWTEARKQSAQGAPGDKALAGASGGACPSAGGGCSGGGGDLKSIMQNMPVVSIFSSLLKLLT